MAIVMQSCNYLHIISHKEKRSKKKKKINTEGAKMISNTQLRD